MRSALFISPHFDDAVLSAGQYMADRPDIDVVTVFAGTPITADNVKTPYDLKCGFDNARNAVGARVRENDTALALLQARAINLNFPDSQYENEFANHADVVDIMNDLKAIIDKGYYEFIMAPLGLGHPDHIKTTEAVMKLQVEIPIYLWEDLPLRVVEPELVQPRLDKYNITLDKLESPSTTDTKIARKIRALMCYKSQIYTGILDPYLLYVPERFWKYK